MKNNNPSVADYFFHEKDESETCFRFGLMERLNKKEGIILIDFLLKYPKKMLLKDMFSEKYINLIFTEGFTKDEKEIFLSTMQRKLEDIINSFLVDESITSIEEALSNSCLYKVLKKMDKKLKKKIKQYQKNIDITDEQEKELKKIFTLFDVNIKEQVAYLRRIENKDMITSKFLLKLFETSFALYLESNKIQDNDLKFEYIHDTNEHWLDIYIQYYKKSDFYNHKSLSKLTENDWKKILPMGLYENGKKMLYYYQLNDIKMQLNTILYHSMRYYLAAEEKPRLETVLTRNEYRINPMILLQDMQFPAGNHNNSLFDIQNAKISNDSSKKEIKPGKMNKIKNLQAICLDFDITDNPRFNYNIEKFQRETATCLYTLLTTEYKSIPNFIVNTEHGLHVVFKIVKMPFSKDNLILWKNTVQKMIDTLSKFGFVADEISSLNPLFTIRLPFMRQQKTSFEEEYITNLAGEVYEYEYTLSDLEKTYSIENFSKSLLLKPKYGTINEVDFNNNNMKGAYIHSVPLKKNSYSYSYSYSYSSVSIYYHNEYIDAIINHDTETYKVLLAPYNLYHAEIGWYDFCEYLKQINMHDIIGIREKYFNCIFHDDKHPSAEIVLSSQSKHWRYNCHSASCSFWFTNISLIQMLRHNSTDKTNFGETVLWLAKVLDAKLEKRIEDIQFATSEKIDELNNKNLDIFNQVCSNHPWIKSLQDCYICILQAFKLKIEEACKVNYTIPIFAIDKPFAKRFLTELAVNHDLKIKSESKMGMYLNILISLGFVSRLLEIPDWDTLNAKIKNTKKKKNTYNDISYYHYKELTNDDILAIEDNCLKIEAYFTEQYQKEFLETGKIHKYPYPVIKNITKKVLKEIFK